MIGEQAKQERLNVVLMQEGVDLELDVLLRPVPRGHVAEQWAGKLAGKGP